MWILGKDVQFKIRSEGIIENCRSQLLLFCYYFCYANTQ